MQPAAPQTSLAVTQTSKRSAWSIWVNTSPVLSASPASQGLSAENPRGFRNAMLVPHRRTGCCLHTCRARRQSSTVLTQREEGRSTPRTTGWPTQRQSSTTATRNDGRVRRAGRGLHRYPKRTYRSARQSLRVSERPERNCSTATKPVGSCQLSRASFRLVCRDH